MYKIDQKFGAKLYRAKRKEDLKFFVIKSVKQADLIQDNGAGFNNEAVALKKVRSDHIIGFFDVFEYNQTFLMILEYISGGSLTPIIRKHESFTTEFCQYTLYCVA